MRKAEELSDFTSCLNRATLDERLFVLLGRDVAAPATIRFWCDERVRLGKNAPDDPQILEARLVADLMAAAPPSVFPSALGAGAVSGT